MKRYRIFIVVVLALIVLASASIAVPRLVSAHSQSSTPTEFYACEAVGGQIDAESITQVESTLPGGNCSQDAGFTTEVQWSVQGPAGTNGVDGQPGLKGDTGPAGPIGPVGPAGIPFSHAPCSEVLSGSAQQENLLFCQSGIEPDGGLIYKTAIAAAKVHIIVGTPIASFASVDWGNASITYVEFSSGLHMEYHSDNVVRVYNTLSVRVF